MSARSDTSCGCGEANPSLSNLPGQATISYRVATFHEVRAALLAPRSGEHELSPWRPTAGDLGLQLVEWFAYLADILTFYNEQAANSAYLGTAFMPGSVEQLVRVLGYRPRPGIGAKGVLGAVLTPTSSGSVTIPIGFAVQSKPDPAPPQVFELDATRPFPVPAVGELAVRLEAPALNQGFVVGLEQGILLKGVVSGVKAHDRLMLATLTQPPARDARMVVVASVGTELSPSGDKNTRVKFSQAFSLTQDPTNYALFRSNQSMGRRAFDSPADAIGDLPLASLARSLRINDAISRPGSSDVYRVASYREVVSTLPGNPNLPVMHSVIHVATLGDLSDIITTSPLEHPPLVMARVISAIVGDTSAFDSIDFGFRPVARLTREPVASPVPRRTGLTLTAEEAPRVDVAVAGVSALLVDATGNGVLAQLGSDARGASLDVAIDEPRELSLPLSLLFATIPVSRGKTVEQEILGSGDATQAGQVFTLRKAPLTYFAGPDPNFPSSTLRVWVNGVEWSEVRSFFQQPADAQVFVTRETAVQKTEVVFGDGVNGARLPSGAENVVATYRFGSGRAAPAVGSLTSILKPVSGLRSLKHPIAVQGGDDPEPAARIREYAPRSVLTFGRAISAGDYESIAAQAPAVTRARAYFGWDPRRQRALVKVYVGDDDAARDSARKALDAGRDRNQPLAVLLARELPVFLALTLVVDPRYDAGAVSEALAEALRGDERGLFSAKILGVGERLYESRLVAKCLSVPGAVAVHDLRMAVTSSITTASFRPSPERAVGVPNAPVVLDPGEGGFFTLARSNLAIAVESSDV